MAKNVALKKGVGLKKEAGLDARMPSLTPFKKSLNSFLLSIPKSVFRCLCLSVPKQKKKMNGLEK